MFNHTTCFKFLLVIVGIIFHNALLAQFDSKQLSKDVLEQMIEIDLNNDGELDIVSVGFDSIDNQSNHLIYFENDSGFYLEPISIGRIPVEHEFELRSEDIDNDGFRDLVYIDKSSGKISLFKNSGVGGFSNPILLINQFFGIDGIEFVDLDNDNLLDIVLSSTSTNEIVWFKNLDLLVFDTGQTIVSLTNGNYTIKIAFTDYNQDGNSDLFYISQISKELMQVTNLGNGTFSNPIQLDYYTDLINNTFIPVLSCIDINQDGTKDLVVNMLSSWNDNIFWYLINSGSISSRNQLTPNGISSLNQPTITKSIDLNMDGFNELVIVDYNAIRYFANNNGIISSTPTNLLSNFSGFISDVVFKDINNDNLPDVIVDIYESGIRSYIQNSNSVFNLNQILRPEILTPIFTSLYDVDADGLNDILYFQKKSLNINWKRNLGNNVFGSSQEYTSLSNPSFFSVSLIQFYVADIDNDNVDDLLTLKGSTSHGFIEFYKGIGNMMYQSPIPISPIPTSLTSFSITNFNLIDVDSDDDLDVVYCSVNTDQFGFYRNLGSGSFSSSQIIDNSSNDPNSFVSTDVDNDNDLDFVLASTGDNKLRLIKNNNSISYATPIILASNLNAGIYQLFIEDIDGDSLDDIVSSEQNNLSSKIGWYKNLGNGTFSNLQLISDYFNSPVTEVLDYDLDGDPDIVCSSSSYIIPNKGTFLLENLGNGIFPENGPRLLSVASKYYSKGDTDNDGDIDLVSCNVNRIFLSINNHNCKTTVTGRVFFDQNQNGTLDSAEIGLNFHPIYTVPLNNYIFSDAEGNYSVSFFDSTQQHVITAQTIPNWNLTTFSNFIVSVSTQFNQIDSVNFGFYPSQLVDSIETNIIGGFPRCNDTINYWLNIRNLGSTVAAGLIKLDLDSNITFIHSDPLPDSISNGNLFWNYDSLNYFSNQMINLQVGTPNYLLIGNELISVLEVSVRDASNNITFLSSDTLIQNLVCAYDPNDKSSNPVGIGYPGYVNDLNEIEYLIRFQNTGNDTATVVVVNDQLDALLDWSTFEPVCGSHQFSASVDQNGKVTFTFFNINLPDSNVNEIASHGFVCFKIKALQSVNVGSEISNFAEIYFDLNPPVLTNSKLLTVFDCKSVFKNASSLINQYCLDETFEFGIKIPETIYTWSYNQDTTIFSSTLVSLVASNPGLNSVLIHAENDLCNIDSLVQFTTIPTSYQSLGVLQICQGDSVLIFNDYESVSGIYYDTLQSQFGCDSIVSKELVVGVIPYQSLGSFRICQGDSVLIFNDFKSVSGVYFDTLQTQFGCDSIVSKELIVDAISYQSLGVLQICQGDSVLIFNDYKSVSGVYYDTLQSVSGCDSIVSKELVVGVIPYQSLGVLQICQGDSVLIFNDYKSVSGVYFDTLQTQFGCDSIVSKELIVSDMTEVSFGYFSNDTLCFSNNVVVFDNVSPLGGTFDGNGVTGNVFDIQQAGVGVHSIVYYYTNSDLCTNSDTLLITVESCLSISDLLYDDIQVYPNPTSGGVFVHFENIEATLILRDINNKVLLVKEIISDEEIDLSTFSKGVYLFEFTMDNGSIIKRVVKT